MLTTQDNPTNDAPASPPSAPLASDGRAEDTAQCKADLVSLLAECWMALSLAFALWPAVLYDRHRFENDPAYHEKRQAYLAPSFWALSRPPSPNHERCGVFLLAYALSVAAIASPAAIVWACFSWCFGPGDLKAWLAVREKRLLRDPTLAALHHTRTLVLLLLAAWYFPAQGAAVPFVWPPPESLFGRALIWVWIVFCVVAGAVLSVLAIWGWQLSIQRPEEKQS